MEPLIKIKDVFWNREDLLQEAKLLKETSYVFGTPPKIVRAFPMNERTPCLLKFYKDFEKKYGSNLGEVSVSYMYIDAEEEYPWHVDEEITKTTGNNPKGVLCAFNVLLLGDENKVEFKDVGEFSYKAAIFNTSHMHRVAPSTDRILCRIGFRDLSYEEMVRKVKTKINN